MLEGNRTLFQEILAVLEAEMECAESLEATTSEIQSLIDHDQYEQMRDRLSVRGEVFDMMISLDRQMQTLVEKRVPGSDIEEWQTVQAMGEKVRNLMIAIMQMDATNKDLLIRKKEEINCELQKLQTEKKGIKGYAQAYSPSHLIQIKG